MPELTEDIQSCILMAAAALAVKNTAIETLVSENAALRSENEQLVSLASAKGGDQVPQLLTSLAAARLDAQHNKLEVQRLKTCLQEETELREDLERELEDTAAAAQELWESMQAVYSEAAESRAHSDQASEGSEDEWGTPPAAPSPVPNRAPSPIDRSIAAAAAAALAATAAAQCRSAARAAATADTADAAENTGASTPRPQLSAAVLNAAPSPAAAAAAVAAGINPPLTGILTPLENKMASLSHRLMGLVSWLDARDASSQASTPRSASALLGSSTRSHVSPLPLGSPINSIGMASPRDSTPTATAAMYTTDRCIGTGDAAATPDSSKAVRSSGSRASAGPNSSRKRLISPRLSPKLSPRLDMAAVLAAAAAVNKASAGQAAIETASSSAVDVDRVKDRS